MASKRPAQLIAGQLHDLVDLGKRPIPVRKKAGETVIRRIRGRSAHVAG